MSTLGFLIFCCSQVSQLLLMSLSLASPFPRSPQPAALTAYRHHWKKRFSANTDLPGEAEEMSICPAKGWSKGRSNSVVSARSDCILLLLLLCFSGGSVECGATEGGSSLGMQHTGCRSSARWAWLGWYQLTQPGFAPGHLQETTETLFENLWWLAQSFTNNWVLADSQEG